MSLVTRRIGASQLLPVKLCSIESQGSTAPPSEASTPRSLDFDEEPLVLAWDYLLTEPDESLLGRAVRAKPPRKFAAYEGVVTAIVDGRLKVRFSHKRIGEQLLPEGHAVEVRGERSPVPAVALDENAEPETARPEAQGKAERRRQLRQADRAARAKHDPFADAGFAGSMTLGQFLAMMRSEVGNAPGPAC